MRPRSLAPAFVGILLCAPVVLCADAQAQSVSYAWGVNIGSSAEDHGYDVAIDAAGDVYHVGYTWGQMGDSSTPPDGYIVKLDRAGQRLWTKQFSADILTPFGVAGAPGGGILVSGCGAGYGGSPHYGEGDMAVAKYDAAGNLIWAAAGGGDRQDQGRGIAVDRQGNSYVVGYTWSAWGQPKVDGFTDAFICKVSAAGQFEWVRQYGGAGQDESYGVATDAAGNVYMAGTTCASIGGPNAGDRDGFIIKLAPDGTELWARQYGTAGTDDCRDITADDLGNVYVAERTLLRKLTQDGDLVWAKPMPPAPMGGHAQAYVMKVASDGVGGVLAECITYGSYAAPGFDIDLVLARLDGAGNMTWAIQVPGDYYPPWGIAYDGISRVYVSGDIHGEALPGSTYAGGPFDGFVAAFDVVVPEPATLSLLALGGLAVIRGRR